MEFEEMINEWKEQDEKDLRLKRKYLWKMKKLEAQQSIFRSAILVLICYPAIYVLLTIPATSEYMQKIILISCTCGCIFSLIVILVSFIRINRMKYDV